MRKTIEATSGESAAKDASTATKHQTLKREPESSKVRKEPSWYAKTIEKSTANDLATRTEKSTIATHEESAEDKSATWAKHETGTGDQGTDQRADGRDTAPEGPILSLTWDCDEQFQSCFEKSRSSLPLFRPRLNDCGRRFTAWWEHLGVFAGPRADLDRRLQRHPDVQDIVLRLLLILKRNLVQLNANWELAVHGQISLSSAPTHDVDGEDAVALSADNLSRIILEAMDDSLEQLHRVGDAIRQSARDTETVRARAYASTNLDLEAFESSAKIALQNLYPNAPESLLLQLSDSMKDRFAILRFRASRQQILNTDRRPSVRHKADQGPPSNKDDHREVSQTGQYNAEPRHKDVAKSATVPSNFQPTDIGTLNLRSRLQHLHGPRSRSGTTVAPVMSANEPEPPQFRDSNGVVLSCPWCFAKPDGELTKGHQWTDLGRAHYRKDLKPFPCISEECTGLERCFSSTSEWSAHMFDHDPLWAQHIHHNPVWVCNDHESPALFSNHQRLQNHLGMVHHGSNQGGTGINSSLREITVVSGHRGIETCPICGFRLDGDLEKQNLASVPQAMVRHVVEHLQNMLKLSLRLIELQENHFDEKDNHRAGSSDKSVGITERRQEIADLSTLSSFHSPPPSQTPIEAVAEGIILRSRRHTLVSDIMEMRVRSNFQDPEWFYYPTGSIRAIITQAAVEKEFAKFGQALDTLDKDDENKAFYEEFRGIHRDTLASLSRWVAENAHKAFATACVSGFDPLDLLSYMATYKENMFTDEDLSSDAVQRLTMEFVAAPVQADAFSDCRWRFLAPRFSPQQFDYNLSESCIFPFTKDATMPKAGLVSKVKVHPEHQEHPNIEYVAIKEIQVQSDKDINDMIVAWEDEAEALRHSNKLRHKHIMRCLAAIRRGDHRYFMFPWAEGGNLQDYWNKIHRQGPNEHAILEAIVQLRGLTDGLCHLHNPNGSIDLHTVPGADTDRGVSIRHCNLKPENILRFFDEGESVTGLGTLKIADMGLAKQLLIRTSARFKSSLTDVSRYDTIRYEAPESANPTGFRSPLHDIWSLGCIILEFIIWLLYGNNALEEFHYQLDEELKQSTPFFKISNPGNVPQLHPVVSTWIDHILHNDPECLAESAIRDLLQLAYGRLLVVTLAPRDDSVTSTPMARATAAELLRSLDTILSKAEDRGSSYLVINGDNRSSVSIPERKASAVKPSPQSVPDTLS